MQNKSSIIVTMILCAALGAIAGSLSTVDGTQEKQLTELINEHCYDATKNYTNDLGARDSAFRICKINALNGHKISIMDW